MKKRRTVGAKARGGAPLQRPNWKAIARLATDQAHSDRCHIRHLEEKIGQMEHVHQVEITRLRRVIDDHEKEADEKYRKKAEETIRAYRERAQGDEQRIKELEERWLAVREAWQTLSNL